MNKSNYLKFKKENLIVVKTSWFMNILVAIDQLGNAIVKGNPDNTISSRIGYFMHSKNRKPNLYWKTLERIVDFTFYPIDGIKHCEISYLKDKEEYFDEGNIISRFFLFLMVVVICFPLLIIIIRIIAFIFPKSKNTYSMNNQKISLKEVNKIRASI